MALIVIATNQSNLADVSDYDVEVSINRARYIYTGLIKNHTRSNGAAALLRLIADAMEAHPRSEPKRA